MVKTKSKKDIQEKEPTEKKPTKKKAQVSIAEAVSIPIVPVSSLNSGDSFEYGGEVWTIISMSQVTIRSMNGVSANVAASMFVKKI